jgi:adenosylmethionine-8-amino-7-oxononanoate aminotransferase
MAAVPAKTSIYDLHEGPGARHRALPRLHLLGASRSPALPASPPSTSTRRERLFERSASLEAPFADALFDTIKGLPLVEDIRTIGLVGAVDLAPMPGAPGLRAYTALEKAFHEVDLMMRITGDTIAISPPLVITESEIDELMGKLKKTIELVA